jgi:hypothetical protein
MCFFGSCFLRKQSVQLCTQLLFHKTTNKNLFLNKYLYHCHRVVFLKSIVHYKELRLLWIANIATVLETTMEDIHEFIEFFNDENTGAVVLT